MTASPPKLAFIGPAGKAWHLSCSEIHGTSLACALLDVPGLAKHGEWFLLSLRAVNPHGCPPTYELDFSHFPCAEPCLSHPILKRRKRFADLGAQENLSVLAQFECHYPEDLGIIFALVTKTIVNGYLLPLRSYQPEWELMCERWSTLLMIERTLKTALGSD